MTTGKIENPNDSEGPDLQAPLTIRLSGSTREWLEEQVDHANESRSEFPRKIIENAQFSGSHDRVKPKTIHDKRKRFIEKVGEVFDMSLAIEECGFTLEEVTKWMREPSFASKINLNRAAHVGKVERQLAKAALGMKTSQPNVLAAITFLNANKPEYGLIRITALKQAVSPLMKLIADVLLEHFGEQGGKTVEGLMKKISDGFELANSKKYPS